MSQGFYSTTQCERMLLAYLVKDIQSLAIYTMNLQTNVFTSQARSWIFLILKKNYLYSKSLTSKDMFYIQMQQQLDARQEKFGKQITEQLDIIYSLKPQDSIQLVVRKLQQANVAAQLVNVMQTTHGYLSSGNVQQAIDAYKRSSMLISLSQKKKQTTGLFSDGDSWLQDIKKRKQQPQLYAGLKTGFTRFDDMTGGLFPAQLTIFFGLSGKGKSTILKNIVDRVVKSGHNVLFVPNEQNKRQVETKFISLMTNIPGYLFKTGKFDQNQYHLVQKFLHNKGNKGQIFIHPLNQGVDATIVQRVFNQIESKGIKIDLIVVDYLDLMGSPFKTYSEWDQQAKITNSLKQLAINCSVPVVTCTQAAIESQKQQKKDNPFLTQSDIYGAKAKVHTANTLIGLVNKTASNDIQPDTNNNPIHKIVLCVCKNRDGACFAFRQNMYARTGLMVNNDQEISLTQAQAALAKQMEKVQQLDKQFAKQNQKQKVNKQLKNFNKQTNIQDDQFLDENFDYLKDTPSVSDQQIKQKMQQINKEQEKLQNVSDQDILNEFLNATESNNQSQNNILQQPIDQNFEQDNNEDSLQQQFERMNEQEQQNFEQEQKNIEQTINNYSSISEQIQNRQNDNTYKVNNIQINDNKVNQQQTEMFEHQDELLNDNKPKKLSAYELFKRNHKK